MTTQCDYIFEDGSQCIGFAGHVGWQMDASFHVRWMPPEDRWQKLLDVTRINHIFLDDGGVMNNNRLRGPQWRQLVGEFFPSRLGGDATAWSEANWHTLRPVDERFFTRLDTWHEARDYAQELRTYDIDWLRSMCKEVGVEAPHSDEDYLALTQEATSFIMPRVRAAFPGALDAIRDLSSKNALYTASQGRSSDLALHLASMDKTAGSFFQRLYGPDLVNWPKTGTRYYERIFEDANVDPGTVLVVDDSPNCVTWARKAGAQAVLIGEGRPTEVQPETDGTLAISALWQLPALLNT